MKAQHGAVLVLVLVVLAGVSIVSLAAARSSVVWNQSARHVAGQSVAQAAAQMALADAEREIVAGSRASIFSDPQRWPAAGCGSDATAGICVPDRLPAWRRVDLAESADTIALGSFTNARLPVARHSMPAKLPRYLVEALPGTEAGEDASAPGDPVFRITAIGYGPDARTVAVVQSTFRLERP